MKMEVFEYNIYAKKEIIAGTNDLDLAKKIAFKIAEREHCDVDIINAFTGEVHQSLVCYAYAYVAHDPRKMQPLTLYKVKEREW